MPDGKSNGGRSLHFRAAAARGVRDADENLGRVLRARDSGRVLCTVGGLLGREGEKQIIFSYSIPEHVDTVERTQRHSYLYG